MYSKNISRINPITPAKISGKYVWINADSPLEISIERLGQIQPDALAIVCVGSNDPDFGNYELIDLIFAKKVIALRLPLLIWRHQGLLEHLADKIDNTPTLLEIGCTNGNLPQKGFFDISSTQRKKISNIIQRHQWDTEVFSKHLFKDLVCVHSYRSTDL